jgi:hypothetical protein
MLNCFCIHINNRYTNLQLQFQKQMSNYQQLQANHITKTVLTETCLEWWFAKQLCSSEGGLNEGWKKLLRFVRQTMLAWISTIAHSSLATLSSPYKLSSFVAVFVQRKLTAFHTASVRTILVCLMSLFIQTFIRPFPLFNRMWNRFFSCHVTDHHLFYRNWG